MPVSLTDSAHGDYPEDGVYDDDLGDLYYCCYC